MDNERQVRFNSRRSVINPECMEWWFLIVNDLKETSDIATRIYELFAPIEEEGVNLSGRVNADLRYRLINFESRKKVEKKDIKKVYHGRFLLDRKLYPGRESERLENYIESVIG